MRSYADISRLERGISIYLFLKAYTNTNYIYVRGPRKRRPKTVAVEYRSRLRSQVFWQRHGREMNGLQHALKHFKHIPCSNLGSCRWFQLCCRLRCVLGNQQRMCRAPRPPHPVGHKFQSELFPQKYCHLEPMFLWIQKQSTTHVKQNQTRITIRWNLQRGTYLDWSGYPVRLVNPHWDCCCLEEVPPAARYFQPPRGLFRRTHSLPNWVFLQNIKHCETTYKHLAVKQIISVHLLRLVIWPSSSGSLPRISLLLRLRITNFSKFP